jgi:hypothetical protein
VRHVRRHDLPLPKLVSRIFLGSVSSESLRAFVAAARARVGRYVAIDTRALGLFRIAFGLVLLGDLVDRMHGRDFLAFYTDRGLLPIARARAIGVLGPTLFALARSPRSAAVLVGAIALVYVVYTMGLLTRVMQVLVVAAYVSLDNRNPLLRNGGVVVIHTLALWTAFLPLGERFSLDAHLRRREPRASCASLATFGLLVNLSWIYLFNCVHKSGTTWQNGSAVHYALWMNQYATALGGVVRAHEPAWLSPVFTYGTLALEGSLPLLILTPILRERSRTLAAALIVSFHGGISLFMTLGCFCYVMMAYGVLLLGPRACARIEEWGAALRLHPPRRPSSPASPLVAASGRASALRSVRAVAARVVAGGREALAAAVLVALVADASVGNRSVPGAFRLDRLSALTRAIPASLLARQAWSLFAPDPPRREAVLVVDAELADGTHVDPLTGGVPDLDAPVRGPYRDDEQWSHLRRRLVEAGHEPYEPSLWSYVLRHPDREHRGPNKAVVAFQAFRVSARSPEPGGRSWSEVTAEQLYSWPRAGGGEPIESAMAAAPQSTR